VATIHAAYPRQGPSSLLLLVVYGIDVDFFNWSPSSAAGVVLHALEADGVKDLGTPAQCTRTCCASRRYQPKTQDFAWIVICKQSVAGLTQLAGQESGLSPASANRRLPASVQAAVGAHLLARQSSGFPRRHGRRVLWTAAPRKSLVSDDAAPQPRKRRGWQGLAARTTPSRRIPARRPRHWWSSSPGPSAATKATHCAECAWSGQQKALRRRRFARGTLLLVIQFRFLQPSKCREMAPPLTINVNDPDRLVRAGIKAAEGVVASLWLYMRECLIGTSHRSRD